MALTKDVNVFTLYPQDLQAKEMLLSRLYSKTFYILSLAAVFACMGCLLNMIVALCSGDTPFEGKGTYAPAITDGARTGYYLVMLILGRFFPSIRFIGAWSVPVVFSISVTEGYLAISSPGSIYTRILSVSGVLFIQTKYLATNYVFAVLTALFAFIYPVIRSQDFSVGTSLYLFNATFAYVICSYGMRKTFVSDSCRLFETKRINEQWREYMQDLPIGIAIIDLAQDFAVVGHNKAIIDMLLNNLHPDLPKDCLNSAIKQALLKTYVKPLVPSEQKNDPELAAQMPFSQFIANPYKNSHGFLDLPDDHSVELRLKRGIYEYQDVLFVTFVDCSLAQRLEKAKTENRCKTLIMSTVSHELRTPINAVLGSLETISQYIPPEGQAYIELAKNSCHMLSYQINDLTDYGKVTDAKLVLGKSKVDLEVASKECISLVSWQARGKGLKVEFFKAPTAPQFIWTNERRLKQILLNLLTNAIKFTEKGEIKVKVKAAKGNVDISVKDTGVGIKDKDLSKLFKEFEMLETHRAMNPNGTGLGLYLSRRLINEMQGDISVKSTLNKGSQFTMHLPMKINTADFNTAVEAPSVIQHTAEVLIQMEETKEKECSCAKILAVDDNDTNLFVVKELLKRLNVECDTARNGVEAVKAVEIRKETNKCCNFYQLVMMDCYMPEMDGFEAAKRIKELGVKSHIVALTGESEDDVKEHTKGLFENILCKPISLQKISELLEDYKMLKK